MREVQKTEQVPHLRIFPNVSAIASLSPRCEDSDTHIITDAEIHIGVIHYATVRVMKLSLTN